MTTASLPAHYTPSMWDFSKHSGYCNYALQLLNKTFPVITIEHNSNQIKSLLLIQPKITITLPQWALQSVQ